MAGNFTRVFGSIKPVIAMVHLGALPGAPLHDPTGGVEAIIEAARKDLAALAGGRRRCRDVRQRERPALRARRRYRLDRDHGLCHRPAAQRNHRAVRRQRPVGPDDARWRLRLRPVQSFAREIFTGLYASDMGLWAPDAGKAHALSQRARPRRPRHALQCLRRICRLRSTGAACPTGRAARCFPASPTPCSFPARSPARRRRCRTSRRSRRCCRTRRCSPTPGVKHATVADVLRIADGCIVGSSLKVDGHTWNAVDPERAADFMAIVRKARG